MKKLLAVAAVALGIGLAACNKDNGGGVTTVNVRLTDAPGAYDALFLSIKEVHIITSEGQNTLSVNSPSFDLLEYTMGRDTLIASQEVAAGTLQEVRLVLNQTGNSVVIHGQTYPLTTPSGQTSGVKIKVHDDLQEGVAYTMTLDFDAAQSIVKTGNGKYILKPVIRAIPNAVSGSITGVVNPATSSPKIYAIAGADTLGTVTDENGKFWFPGVAPGTYKIEIRPVSPYTSKSIEGVTVTTGSVKDLGTITITQ